MLVPSLPIRLTLLLSVATLIGCAAPSLPMPPGVVVVDPPKPISRPAVAAPGPSGAYWRRHCALLQRVRETVSSTEPLPEPCGTRGHDAGAAGPGR
jgi:hypothetical protein